MYCIGCGKEYQCIDCVGEGPCESIGQKPCSYCPKCCEGFDIELDCDGEE